MPFSTRDTEETRVSWMVDMAHLVLDTEYIGVDRPRDTSVKFNFVVCM